MTGVAFFDIDSFQLEEGVVATEYERPAPAPDYPIEIYSLNDFDVVSSAWRNLVNQRGQIDGLGLNTGWDNFFSNAHNSVSIHLIEVKEGEELRFTKETTGRDEYWRNQWWDSDMNYISRFVDTSNDFIRTVPRNAKYLRVSYPTTSNPKIDRDFIRLSDIPEYHELIDKINLLLDEPLRSVGDVKDRLFRDVDGLWKVERNVGKVVLDGSEGGYRDLGIYNDFQRIKFPDMPKLKLGTMNAVSSHFPMGGVAPKENSIYVHSSTLYHMGAGISHNLATNLDEFKRWLQINNLNIYYELSNSNIETLPQSLQDKLNNLRSFENSNYVYTAMTNENNYLSENLKPTLHAKFLYNNWYKEDRVINNLMIYNRALTNEEMLQNYKTIKRRWGM